MTKEEVKEIINKHIEDNEKAVLILEEIDDFVETDNSETIESEYRQKYEELLQKYRDRFMNGEPVKDENEDVKEISEKEKVVDITEI